jgi:hypothetical protein
VEEITQEKFSSWENFKSEFTQKLFGAGSFERGRFLFRGQRDPKWELTSTFDRMFKAQSKGKRLQIAEAMIARFRAAIEVLDVPTEVRTDHGSLLALAQHYGLPTRLLDWSESPYVAGFFAYNSRALWGETDQHVCIWVLDTKDPIWSAQYGVEILDVPLSGNHRLRNQSGKFTLARTPFLSLEEYVTAHGDARQPLRKFLLPGGDWTKALADLDAMGINHAHVYPEVEGAAQMALFATVMEYQAHVETSTARPA